MAIRKEFWRLAWPAAAEGLLLMLLTAADLLMVSSLGNTAVAAVSIFSQPRMVILCVTRSYSVALSAYVARRRGEDPDESPDRLFPRFAHAGVRSLDTAPGRDLDWSRPASTTGRCTG